MTQSIFDAQAKQVVGFKDGASTPGGEVVRMRLMFRDGSEGVFEFPSGAVEQIVTSLVGLGQMAFQQAGAKSRAATEWAGYPIPVTNASFAQAADPTNVILVFDTGPMSIGFEVSKLGIHSLLGLATRPASPS